MKRNETSWEAVSNWYDDLVGEKGHYYHEQVIFPALAPLLALNEKSRLLDLACGQGILSRVIPEKTTYLGIDAAASLIRAAQSHNKKKNATFLPADLTEPLVLKEEPFTHATIILALQNIAKPEMVLNLAAKALVKGGKLLIVLNHPCFRIPRQSSWGVDPAKKLQYRRIDSYLSPMQIPIQAHPGAKSSQTTYSFHLPLSHYTKMLRDAGFQMMEMQEWTSNKTSQGAAAKMENRSRKEFPLFLAILATSMG